MKKIFAFIVFYAVQSSATENDTYNFYFQKAPGPQTVTQGGASAAAPVAAVTAAPATPVETAVQGGQSVVKTAEPQEPRRPWEITAGYGFVSDDRDRYKGYGLGVTYELNKYVEASFNFVYAKEYWDKGKTRYSNLEGRDSPLDVALGINLMPVQIKWLGYSFFELGVAAGFMTYVKGSTDRDSRRRLEPYLGPRFVINFSKRIGLTTEFRLRNDNRFGQATSGLSYRF